jgi:translation initiation factor IF-3
VLNLVDINRLRVNFQIRIPQVRLMQNGEQLGIMPTEKARNLAFDQGLDLVEMVPNAHPPVCHIIDYSKYKYEQKVKQKEYMKKQREMVQAVKEIRLSPAIGQHDLDIKIKHILEFLRDDKKVQIFMKFRSRETQHKEVGFEKINQILEKCKEFSNIELHPKFEGSKLICRLAPQKTKVTN